MVNLEIIIRQNQTDTEMVEILQNYGGKLCLFSVCHRDLVYLTEFEERIKEGEEITFILTEKTLKIFS